MPRDDEVYNSGMTSPYQLRRLEAEGGAAPGARTGSAENYDAMQSAPRTAPVQQPPTAPVAPTPDAGQMQQLEQIRSENAQLEELIAQMQEQVGTAPGPEWVPPVPVDFGQMPTFDMPPIPGVGTTEPGPQPSSPVGMLTGLFGRLLQPRGEARQYNPAYSSYRGATSETRDAGQTTGATRYNTPF